MMSETTFKRIDADGMNSSFASEIVRIDSDVSGINRDITSNSSVRRGTHQSNMTDTSFNRVGEVIDDEDESDQFGDALFKKSQ